MIELRPPGELVEALLNDPEGHYQSIGKKVGVLYTDDGLPIDMSLDRLNLGKQQKIAVLSGALTEIIEHKRRSGAPDKAIERTRKNNRDAMANFIKTGEVGFY